MQLLLLLARAPVVRANRSGKFPFRGRTDAKSEYQGGNGVAHHSFCARCGNHVYDYIETPNMTGRPYVNVNLACLEDVAPEELLAAPIRYCDGRNDAWGETPSEARHL
jgi:hypothetical protein